MILILVLCTFLTGCGGIIRQSKLTLLPSRNMPKIEKKYFKACSSAILSVKGVESLQSEFLTVLEKEGTLIAHPNKTWLRSPAILIEEAFKDIWYQSTGKYLNDTCDKELPIIEIILTECYYDEIEENVKISMLCSYKIFNKEDKNNNIVIKQINRACKLNDVSYNMLECVNDCVKFVLTFYK